MGAEFFQEEDTGKDRFSKETAEQWLQIIIDALHEQARAGDRDAYLTACNLRVIPMIYH